MKFMLTITNSIISEKDKCCKKYISLMNHKKFSYKVYPRFTKEREVAAYKLQDTLIEIDSLDELIELIKDVGNEVVINAKENPPTIEIYNGYRE